MELQRITRELLGITRCAAGSVNAHGRNERRQWFVEDLASQPVREAKLVDALVALIFQELASQPWKLVRVGLWRNYYIKNVVLFEENSILPLPECLESSGW